MLKQQPASRTPVKGRFRNSRLRSRNGIPDECRSGGGQPHPPCSSTTLPLWLSRNVRTQTLWLFIAATSHVQGGACERREAILRHTNHAFARSPGPCPTVERRTHEQVGGRRRLAGAGETYVTSPPTSSFESSLLPSTRRRRASTVVGRRAPTRPSDAADAHNVSATRPPAPKVGRRMPSAKPHRRSCVDCAYEQTAGARRNHVACDGVETRRRPRGAPRELSHNLTPCNGCSPGQSWRKGG